MILLCFVFNQVGEVSIVCFWFPYLCTYTYIYCKINSEILILIFYNNLSQGFNATYGEMVALKMEGEEYLKSLFLGYSFLHKMRERR